MKPDHEKANSNHQRMMMSPKEFESRVKQVESLAFHRFLGLEIHSVPDGSSSIILNAMENAVNPHGVAHGGIVYAILDVAAYIALLPYLRDDQNAVTHDIHVAMMRPALKDQPLVFKGFVRQKGKRIAFCESEAWSGERLAGVARIAKSIVAL